MTRADAQAPAAPTAPVPGYTVWIGLACALAASGVWLADGLLSTRAGGDSPFLLVRVHQLGQALADGVIPARWMPDAAFGLGYPFFNYYAALPFYLAAVLSMLGLPIITAIKVTQSLGALAAAFGMFALARSLYSGTHATRSAALAAIAYTVAPFHLANVYVRGDSLSEFWACVWFPLILSAVLIPLSSVYRLSSSAYRLLSIAIPLAALVLTHNVSTLLFAPFVAAWALAELWTHRAAPAAALRHALMLLGAAALALALSAWFWLPALGEARAAQLGEQTTGYFNYANHFRLVGLCTPSMLTSACADRPIDQINLVQSTLFADSTPPHAFGMGLVQALAVLLGALLWLRNQGPVRWRVPILFGAATLLMTPLAAPVWTAIPPLQLAQFPWRLLSVQALFASLLIGAIGSINGRRAWLAPLAAGLALCAAVAPMVTQVSSLRIRQDDISARTLQLFEWYSGTIGTTIRAEYLPVSAQPVPATGPDLLGQPRRALIAQDGLPADALTSEIESLEADAQIWRIQVNVDALALTLPLIYSPAWQAIDADSGALLPSAPYPGSGWTQLTLPRGAHRIMLRHVGTPLQRAGERISAAATVLAALMLILILRHSTKAAWRRAGLLALAVMLALAVPVFAERLIQRRALAAQEGEFVDFARQPFVHRGGMTLNEGARQATLSGATVEPRRLVAGEQFTLTLSWHGAAAPVELVQELPSASERFDIFKHDRQTSRITDVVSVHTVPAHTLPGPLLLMLVPVDGWTSTTTEARVAGKDIAGVTLVGPTVTRTAPNAPSISVAEFANGIRAHEIDWLRPDGERICFRARWSRRGAVNQADALQVSFKLRASDGRLAAQADGQPLQGLAPTWSWRDDVVVADSRCVRVVDAKRPLQQDERYRLEITWYRLLTGEVTGQAVLAGTADMRDGALNIPE